MHDYSPLYSPFGMASMAAFLPLIALAIAWTIAIKGYALWHAARAGQRNWFIALLVINSLGILEIVYLLWFREKMSTPAQSSVSAQA
jgi:hypothetical protein